MLPMHETWGNKIFPTPRTSLPPKPCRSRVAPKSSNGQIGLNPLEVLEQVLLLSSSNLKSLGRSISHISVPVFSMFLLSSAFRFPGCCSYRPRCPSIFIYQLILHTFVELLAKQKSSAEGGTSSDSLFCHSQMKRLFPLEP